MHLHARAHVLLLSQHLLREFITPDLSYTQQSVVGMQGGMPAHAGGDRGMPVWEMGRGEMHREGWQCGQKPACKVA